MTKERIEYYCVNCNRIITNSDCAIWKKQIKNDVVSYPHHDCGCLLEKAEKTNEKDLTSNDLLSNS